MVTQFRAWIKNHSRVTIKDFGEHEVYINGYTCTENNDNKLDFVATLEYVEENVEKLYYNLLAVKEVLKICDMGSSEYYDLIFTVNEAINLVDLRDYESDLFFESVNRANEYLENEFFAKKCKPSNNYVACIGHTHIDVAWLWTLNQTVEKAQRSFATVDSLLNEFDEYRFMSSQVPLYKAVKNENPELYSRIKEWVKTGRWEPEGGMYVEADCNLTGGESLIRQFMYGKKFFKDEFDVDSKILWLPDVFGYSAALPQIMNKCDVELFVTSKIGWNDTNDMPHDLFTWKGIDGSEVLTHFITATDSVKDGLKRHTTYNGKATANQIKGSFKKVSDSYLTKTALSSIGYGDGGGGTTKYDCEMMKRFKRGIPSMPTANWTSLKEFRKIITQNSKDNKNLPTWFGELYLEYHRGTYTSQADNKKYNRKCEFLLQNVELITVIANLLNINEFNKTKHDNAWEIELLNQFHDILPGSSINQVYKTSLKQYEKLCAYASELIERNLVKIAERINKNGILVFNPTSFEYSGVVKVNGKECIVKNIPPLSCKFVEENDLIYNISKNIVIGENCIENDYYVVKFDQNMNISQIIDKENDRSLLKENKTIQFVAYEDVPLKYDAWELSAYYKEKIV